MERPKISVIVPVYNAEKYLHRCVNSILAQKFTDFELLLIDDGSKDSSSAICDDYASKDSRIKVFHKENRGPSSTRNVGLEYANGEWIAFCDADDFVYTNWLEILINNISGFDLAVSGFKIEGYDSKIIRNIGLNAQGPVKEIILNFISSEMPGSLWNKLFNANIIHKYNLKLDENIKFREDEEFVLRYMSYCQNVKCVDTPTYHYFEPDWSKYGKYWNHQNAFMLNSKLLKSHRRIGSDNLSKVYLEVSKMMVACIIKEPLKTFSYLKEYFKAVLL